MTTFADAVSTATKTLNIATDQAQHYYNECFAEHLAIVEPTQQALAAPFAALLAACTQSITSGGKIMLCGNGGSAADAQHLATELTVRFSKNRAPIAAIALTTDTSALTAIGNDYDFSHLFSRQVEALCQPNDVLLGITTSGNSDNVIKALEAAKRLGATTAVFTGGTAGKLATLPQLVDHLLCVPTTTTARIQEMHITIGQILCGALEQQLGLV